MIMHVHYVEEDTCYMLLLPATCGNALTHTIMHVQYVEEDTCYMLLLPMTCANALTHTIMHARKNTFTYKQLTHAVTHAIVACVCVTGCVFVCDDTHTDVGRS